MSSKMKEASFVYLKKSFQISCTGKEKVKDIILKFINQYNPKSGIVDYIFFYDGKKIEINTFDLLIEETKFGKLDSFIIQVEKNIRIIKCPECYYNDAVVSLKNYRTIFYNCLHKHLKISAYDKYFKDQVYFTESIICMNCRNNGALEPIRYECLTCSNLLKRARPVCKNCINEHKTQNHAIIFYEDKNYYCKWHIKKMEKYCFQCKRNLCEGCVNDHLKDEKTKGHQIKSFDLLVPDKEEIAQLKNSLNDIEKNMSSLKIVIDDLIYTLRGAMQIYEDYYRIASNIMEKYESFNKGEKDLKNFTIFKTLYNLKFSNNQILEDLKEVIKKGDKIEKAKTLIGIYLDKKSSYYGKDKAGDDLNEEDDTDWFKEVLKREQKRNAKASTNTNTNKINTEKANTANNVTSNNNAVTNNANVNQNGNQNDNQAKKDNKVNHKISNKKNQ